MILNRYIFGEDKSKNILRLYIYTGKQKDNSKTGKINVLPFPVFSQKCIAKNSYEKATAYQ
jgi:hypothetical protein